MTVAVSWRMVPWGNGQVVKVTCPECGEEYRLDHQIATDGQITPSLDCPTAGCGFHEMAHLDGWMPA